MARHVEEHEFDPAAPGEIVATMDLLAAARDGWINLLPGVGEEDVPEPRASGPFGTLFGSAQPPLTMGTWMPPKGKRPAGEETLGIMHPRGRRALAQLKDMGIELPQGWRVRQDHARRGIIVHPVLGAPHAQVLDWALRAGAGLAMVPLTGMWKARVYLPV